MKPCTSYTVTWCSWPVRHYIVFSCLSLSLFAAVCREPQHQSVPYHYYEPRGPDECAMYISHERGRRGSHHRFITEKRVFASWAQTFDIHFYQPDWSPPPLPANRTAEGKVVAALAAAAAAPPVHRKTWPSVSGMENATKKKNLGRESEGGRHLRGGPADLQHEDHCEAEDGGGGGGGAEGQC